MTEEILTPSGRRTSLDLEISSWLSVPLDMVRGDPAAAPHSSCTLFKADATAPCRHIARGGGVVQLAPSIPQSLHVRRPADARIVDLTRRGARSMRACRQRTRSRRRARPRSTGRSARWRRQATASLLHGAKPDRSCRGHYICCGVPLGIAPAKACAELTLADGLAGRALLGPSLRVHNLAMRITSQGAWVIAIRWPNRGLVRVDL